MTETWTLSELVAEAAARLEALPAPKNGQVRAVPDERTIRYYGTIGLLDRPTAMRGRTALYSRRHLAQVVAIKRMQGAGKSLAEIQALWPTLDDATLARMSGVHLAGTAKAKPARKEFWKREIEPSPHTAGAVMSTAKQNPLPPPSGAPAPSPRSPEPAPSTPPWPAPGGPMMLPVPTFTPYPTAPYPASPAITIPLEGGASIVIALPEDAPVSLSPADIRALRAVAAPLVEELAKRGLVVPAPGTLEEEP